MNMPPDHTSNLRVFIDNAQEILAVINTYLVQPVGAYRNWMVMHGDQCMAIAVSRQLLIQPIELFRSQMATHLFIVMGIQSDDKPGSFDNAFFSAERRPIA